MSCRKRCKREIFKFAQYLFRLVTGTLNTGKTPVGPTRAPLHVTVPTLGARYGVEAGAPWRRLHAISA